MENREEEINKIVCPFCNEPFTAEMEADFDYSMGSEWTGIYGENVSVEIKCSKCKKIIYKKNTSV